MAENPYSKVLFIAPDSGLDVAPEIDALAELGYAARTLQGVVTPERVFAAVRNTQFAILHFACHATEAGIQLSQGTQLDVDSVLQVARMAAAKVVFLNGCETSVIGQTLVDENVPVAIVAMREIRDDLAKQTAQAFYKALAGSGDPHEAYKVSKPASRGMYQWLANGGYQRMMLEPILARLGEVAAFKGDLATVVAANQDEHQALRADLARLADAFGDVRRLKMWFLQASGGVIVVMSIIQVALTLVTRQP
jgi:hypothetical protein